MSTTGDCTRDVPMEIGQRFFPRAEIVLPSLHLPKIPSLRNKYRFEVEHRARAAFDARVKQREAEEAQKELEEMKTAALKPSTISISNEVLTPSQYERAPSATCAQPVNTPTAVCFEEFEGKGSVFDELEWNSIDNRKALSQVLCGTSSVADQPVPTTSVETPDLGNSSSLALPSYPTLSFGNSVQPPSSSEGHVIASTTSGSVSFKQATPLPSTVVPRSSVDKPAASNGTNGTVPLRQRLLTKGYREKLVNTAIGKLPRHRIVHIEYYMKGMSLLEKRGVEPDETLTFLLQTGVTDKQEVLKRAQTADQLVGMGFQAAAVFSALLSNEGDKVKSLDQLLQN